MATDVNLERAVAAFLRDALAHRYDTANLRKHPGFSLFSDAQLAALRAYGLQHIYPDWEARCFQQQAFDALMDLLSSPMRLRPLTAVALKSLWRFGRRLPKAIDAGKQVVTAFEATRQLEDRIVALLQEMRADQSIAPESAEIEQALAAVSRDDFETFVEDMTALMRLLAHRDLLETGHAVLGDIADAMEKRFDCYDAIEQEGLRYALTVMDEGMALFDALDEEAVATAIETIPKIEYDWYDAIVSKA